MKRIGRWVVNAMTALSLLLCVATAGLWVRSYWRPYRIVLTLRAAHWDLWWAHGQLILNNGPQVRHAKTSDAAYNRRLAARADRWHNPPWNELYPNPSVWEGTPQLLKRIQDLQAPAAAAEVPFLIRLGPRRGSVPQPARWARSVPAACIPVASGAWLMPLIWARLRRRRRVACGLCGACGYDLTGNVSGVCPECGTDVVTGDA